MIRAHDDRKHKIHVLVFFIFPVSSIGGARFSEMLVCAIVLPALFYAIDSYWYRKERHLKRDPAPESPARIQGGAQLLKRTSRRVRSENSFS